MRFRKTKINLIGLALVAVLSAIALFFVPSRPIDIRNLTPADVSSLEFRLVWYDQEPVRREVRSIDDAGDIATVLNAIKSGEPTQAHECSGDGSFNLFLTNGRREVVGLLWGHDPKYYEFTHNGMYYRVPREHFVSTMREIGIDLPPEPVIEEPVIRAAG